MTEGEVPERGEMSLPPGRGRQVSGSPLVRVWTAANPGPLTLSGTHTYLIGRNRVIVIDPGPDLDDHTAAVRSAIEDDGSEVTAIVLTHHHADHSEAARRWADAFHAPVIAAFLPLKAPDVKFDRQLQAGDVFPVDGEAELVPIATPGHTRDHVAFLLLPGNLLFSGDLILGEGSTLVTPPDGDMVDYIESLRKVRSLRPTMLLPGHGPVGGDAVRRIDEQIEHRESRERQILGAVAARPMTLEQIVDETYRDVHADMRVFARGSVEAQVQKLVREGRVAMRNGSVVPVDHQRA